jgi:hypothetical protein
MVLLYKQIALGESSQTDIPYHPDIYTLVYKPSPCPLPHDFRLQGPDVFLPKPEGFLRRFWDLR